MPSDAQNYITALKYQMIFYLRSRRFIGLLIFSVLVSVAISVLVVHYEYSSLINETSSDFMESFFAGLIITLSALVASFFGGDLASVDTGTEAGFFTLVQPIRRSVLFMGRYTAALISSFLVLLVYYLSGVFTSLYLYSSIPVQTGSSILLLFIFVMALLAFSSFFSSIFKSPLVGIILSIIFLILVFEILQGVIGNFGGIEPWFLVTFAGEITYLVFIKYSTKSVTTFHHITTYTFNPPFYQAVIVMVSYILIFLLISLYIFTRKEIKG